MQDIVFYAVANETLGVVRDYANTRKVQAPVLTIGVSVCLRMRLFADLNTATPYPISAFTGISDWQWRMDGDFDQATTCKLVADSNDIFVQSVSDTIDGETISFTEFVIPISDMNTQELQAWLGNEKKRSGLTGELIGYDSSEKAAFVLQIENFTVRNRVAGLGNPTAVDLEIVTCDQAANMIQTAVSSSAATKQDKLSSANAGTGISIAEGGTISTANVPQSAITGLSASLAAKQDNLTAGDLLEFTSGTALNRKRYMPVFKETAMSKRSITPAGGTASVQALVLEPGNAYQVNAVSASKWFATTAAFKESSEQWGLESHIKLFVAGTGYVRTDTNIVLANALEPNAVNNCTVRFHDGLAIISVEDHVAGYIVVSATGSTAGTLAYALSSSTQEYIAFDATMDAQTLELGGVATNGEKHIVGNSYSNTIVTGGVSCASKTTFSNLSLVNASVLGGTMTLGDVYIPSGSTVSVSGGGLAIEKVTGDGGTIDLGDTRVFVASGSTASASGCTFSGGNATSGGAVFVNAGKAAFTSCTFSGNTASRGILYEYAASLELNSCVLSNNSVTFGDVFGNSGTILVNGGKIEKIFLDHGAHLALRGETVLNSVGSMGATSDRQGTVTISSGAIVDLTGNTNATPINPGGGITFAPGGATVYPSAGSASAYVLGGMTVPKIGNTNVVDLNSSNVVINSGTTASASGCTFSGGSAAGRGGAFICLEELTLENCAVVSCYSNAGQGNVATQGASASVILNNCSITDNPPNDLLLVGGTIALTGGTYGKCRGGKWGASRGMLTIAGNTVIEDVRQRGDGDDMSVIISSGAVLDLRNAVSNAIVPGGGITLYCGSGANGTYLITGGNISRFYKDADRVVGSTITNGGIIYGATVYFPDAADTYEVGYSTDNGTTYQTVDVTGTTEYVVTGCLMSLQQKTV